MSQRTENLEQFAIDVILERRHGIRAALLRAMLYALSFIYERLVQLRLFLYRHRLFREHTLGCLVISIGNKSVPRRSKKKSWNPFARKNPDPPRIVSDGKTLLLDSLTAGDEPYML